MSRKKDIYGLITEIMPDPFIYCQVQYDKEGSPSKLALLDSNPAFARLTGCDDHAFASGVSCLAAFLLEKFYLDWWELCPYLAANSPVSKWEQHCPALFRWYEVLVLQDQPGHFALIFRDITAMKTKLGQMGETETKLHDLLDYAPTGMMYINTRGDIEQMNQCAVSIYGSPSQEATMDHINVFSYPPLHKAARAMKECIAKGAGTTHEEFYRSKWGKSSFLRYKTNPVFDYRGEISGVITTVEDISEQKELERKLQENMDYYLKLLNSTHDPLHVVDQNLQIVLANEQFHILANQASGISTEITGKPLDIAFPFLPQNVIDEYHRIFNSGHAIITEECIDIRNKTYYTETTKSPVFDDKGRVSHVTTVIRVINDRKETEEALRVSEVRYRTLFEGSRDGIVVVDHKRKIVAANPAFCEMLGYSRQELSQKNKGIYQFTPLKWWKWERDNVWSQLLTGHGCSSIYQKEYMKRDGQLFPVEIQAYSMPDNGTQARYFWAVVRNISERKQSEESLLEVNRHLEQILEFFPDPTFVIDDQGKVVFWNQAIEQMTGVAKDEIIGRGDYEYSLPFYGKRRPILIDLALLSNEEYEPLKNQYDCITREENRLSGEVNVPKTYKGKGAYLWGTASKLVDLNGNIIGAIESIRDITDRIENAKKLTYLSFHDPLTGLYNRAFFETEIKRLQKSHHYPITIISADLDGLKMINDTLGHYMGDAILKLGADVLRQSIRGSDILARIGGDEFAIILPGTGEAASQDIINRIHSTVKRYNRQDQELHLSISLGAATALNATVSLEEVYKKADDCMYRYKMHHETGNRSKIIKSLLATLSEKDHVTGGHAERLAYYCMAISRELGLNAQQLNNMALLAQVHDLGKAEISDSILFKNGPLTEEEWTLMQQHPEKGHRMAMASPDLAGIADLILKHHERWDGSGYPLGLKGTAIPVECRILAVVDAFDTMTQPRPYNQAKNSGEAVAELKRCAGTYFDPHIVEVFLHVLENLP